MDTEELYKLRDILGPDGLKKLMRYAGMPQPRPGERPDPDMKMLQQVIFDAKNPDLTQKIRDEVKRLKSTKEDLKKAKRANPQHKPTIL